MTSALPHDSPLMALIRASNIKAPRKPICLHRSFIAPLLEISHIIPSRLTYFPLEFSFSQLFAENYLLNTQKRRINFMVWFVVRSSVNFGIFIVRWRSYRLSKDLHYNSLRTSLWGWSASTLKKDQLCKKFSHIPGWHEPFQLALDFYITIFINFISNEQ